MFLKVCVGLFCDSILLIAQACSDKYTVQVCVCNACLVHIFWVISVNCPVHIMTALNAPPYLWLCNMFPTALEPIFFLPEKQAILWLSSLLSQQAVCLITVDKEFRWEFACFGFHSDFFQICLVFFWNCLDLLVQHHALPAGRVLNHSWQRVPVGICKSNSKQLTPGTSSIYFRPDTTPSTNSKQTRSLYPWQMCSSVKCKC